MKNTKIENQYGDFNIDIENEVLVDSEIGWHINYKLKQSVLKGGKIKITFPAYAHQRSVEYVQNIDYWKPHFIYAYFEDEKFLLKTKVVKIESEFSHVLRWPDSNRIAIIEAKNDWEIGANLHIFYGGIDRMWLKGHAPATRAPHHATFSQGTYLNYKFELDAKANQKYIELEIIPKIKVLPDKAEYLMIKVPIKIELNKEYSIEYIYNDKFKNPLWDYNERPIFIIKNLKTGIEERLKTDKFIIKENGYYEISAETKLSVEKAIFVCNDDKEKIYFGDTHAHSVITPNIRDNNNGGTVEDAYKFAKDAKKIDFLALVEQTFLFDDNENQNVTKKLWDKMGEFSNKHNIPNKFVTFPGFEFHSPRGDTVVILGEDISNFIYPLGAEDIYDIWEKFRNKKYLSIPHFHRYCGGRLFKDEQDQMNTGFDLKKWEASDEAETLCEFYSGQWGRFEYPKNPMLLKAMSNIDDNTVTSFLNRGKMWGVTASSDDHDLTPGHAGLTAVYSDSLTRDDIFKGLKCRHTYATTSTRVYLKYNLNDKMMGDILNYENIFNFEKIDLFAEIVSPVNIRLVEIILDGNVYKNIRINNNYNELNLDIPKSKLEKGSYIYLRYKLEDENIVISSPIWIK